MKKQVIAETKLDQLQMLVRELCQKKPNRARLKVMAEKLGCQSFDSNEDLMEKILLSYPTMIESIKPQPKETELL
jgi:hypothetical protein